MSALNGLLHSVHIGFPNNAIELSSWQTQKVIGYKGKRIGFGGQFLMLHFQVIIS